LYSLLCDRGLLLATAIIPHSKRGRGPNKKESDMLRYANLSGNSGVEAYEVGESFIKVRFNTISTVYVYDYSKPGVRPVEEMKRLAAHGRGLATYIAQEVREDYARKE
jgi:hypothetical protein